MSKVISFRLNPGNQREAEALTILDNWLSQGFCTRHTLTEALLMLDSEKSQSPENETLKDLSHQINELLARVDKGSTHKIKYDHASLKQELLDGFVSSIIRTTKSGLKMEA